MPEFDVCVVGGGMAGLCAAIAAARNGAKTALIHDRPVFGGNASSEVRMWIGGAHGKHNKETGIIEEMQLENCYRNPSLQYSIWDSVLYGKAAFQPGLTPYLNCSVTSGERAGDRLVSVSAWQLTSQTWHHVRAAQFIDCSGDSILAEIAQADFRVGREARHEFQEDIEPVESDLKTMGNSLLIQVRRTKEPQPFIPPAWAYRFTQPEDLPCRLDGVNGQNFWWIEVGGLNDTIHEAELIRDELMKIVYGVWDYIKNYAPEKERAAHWALEWVGALPGKRESRRYLGDHVLTQNDIRAGGIFDDIIAYGGWSMDDHHPAGIFYPGQPTIFHAAPSPYGIPYRCLYSRNVVNLLFAGRNISVTHAALSSTRVMGTCAVLGQAVGTAAALCAQKGCDPRDLSVGEDLRELQATLMDDDCWLPGLRRPESELARSAQLIAAGQDAGVLRDGCERDRENESHAWSGDLGAPLEYRWPQRVKIAGARLVFDSNLSHAKPMPHSYPQKGNRVLVPSTLIREFRLEALDEEGQWYTVHHEQNNYQRFVCIELNIQTCALRFIPEATWGYETVRIFSFEPLEVYVPKIPHICEGQHFRQVRNRLDPLDLAPPALSCEEAVRPSSGA